MTSSLLPSGADACADEANATASAGTAAGRNGEQQRGKARKASRTAELRLASSGCNCAAAAECSTGPLVPFAAVARFAVLATSARRPCSSPPTRQRCSVRSATAFCCRRECFRPSARAARSCSNTSSMPHASNVQRELQASKRHGRAAAARAASALRALMCDILILIGCAAARPSSRCSLMQAHCRRLSSRGSSSSNWKLDSSFSSSSSHCSSQGSRLRRHSLLLSLLPFP